MDNIIVSDGGGNKCSIAIVSGGELLIEPKTFKPESLKDLRNCFDSVISGASNITGVGFVYAGAIINHRYMDETPNNGWLRGLDVQEFFQEAFGLKAFAINDMEGSAEAERRHKKGLLRRINGLVETNSTGWGGASVINGKVYMGEPGHEVSIYAGGPTKRICKCGRLNCREAWSSGGAIEERVLQMFSWKAKNGLIDGLRPAKFLDESANRKEGWALSLYCEVAEELGEGWGSDLNRLSMVDRIVVTGTFAKFAWPFVINRLRERMRLRVMYDKHKKMLDEEMETGQPNLIKFSNIWPHGAFYGGEIIFKRLANAA